jgi:tetratricopeptide (TPR) repeat protein
MVLQYKGAPAESYALYLRRGVELTPGSADAHKAYAVYLSESERHKEALQHLLRAAQLDPLSPIVRVNLAGALQTLGRFDEALAQTQRALDIDPRFLPALFQILQRSSAEEVLVLTSIAYKADANNPSAVLHFVLTYLRLGDDARAEQWVVELDRIAPASWQTSVARLNLSLYRSNQVEAVEYASRLLGYEGGGIGIAIPSRTLLLDDLRRGEPGAALKRYEQVYPGLLTDDPEVTGNYSAAIDLAMLLEVLGEPQKAERLLDRSLAYLSTLPDRRLKEFGIFKARIHAMRDQQEEAFAAMRQAIDAGWTFQWWFHLKQDPAFDSLRDNARFRSLVNEMDAEMARQLEEVRRLEASGEITLPPGT